jgi:formate-dependent nitrite reductase membrane component NrfD
MSKNCVSFLSFFIAFVLLAISGADMMGRRVWTNHLDYGWSAWTFWIGVIFLIITFLTIPSIDDK